MHAGLLPRAPRPQLERRYISAVHPETGTFAQFDEERLNGNSMLDLASAAMPGVPVEDAVWLHEFDAHYYDLRGARSLPVLRVRYANPERTWLYMDPARGGIVLQTDDTRRLRRWLYQGLHSLDFPFLYYKRPDRASTSISPDLPPSTQACVNGAGRTHIHPSWRNFTRIDMQPR